MKSYLIFLCVMATMLASCPETQAELQYLGDDSLGNRLIYDSDLDITWYDYTSSPATWFEQVSWAENLAVDFNENIYADWRLPTTVDGQYATMGFRGNTFSGWNITTSEMGHLFYLGLGNEGAKDIVDGSWTGCGNIGQPSCLANFGDFLNLESTLYYSSDHAGISYYCWYFDMVSGVQYVTTNYENRRAVAVHPGVVGSGIVARDMKTWGTIKAQYR